jgi:hypothetical protein
MSRTAVAVPVGLLGFVLYVTAVVTLADLVLGLHWTLQIVYFALAGVAWVLPVYWLMAWAARGGARPRG